LGVIILLFVFLPPHGPRCGGLLGTPFVGYRWFSTAVPSVAAVPEVVVGLVESLT